MWYDQLGVYAKYFRSGAIMILEASQLKLNVETRRLTLADGREVRVSKTKCALLRCLMEKPGEVRTFAELSMAGWGHAVVNNRCVSEQVNEILGIIGQPMLIVSVQKRGYRFVPKRVVGVLEASQLKLNMVTLTLKLPDGREIRLSKFHCALLGCLMEKPGKVCTFAELSMAGWGRGDVENCKVTLHVLSMSRIIGRPGLIVNLHGLGYKLVLTDSASEDESLEIGRIKIFPLKGVAEVNGESLELSPISFHLLECLCHNQPICTYAQLAEALGRIVTSKELRRRVRLLNSVLAGAGAKMELIAVGDSGFRFATIEQMRAILLNGVLLILTPQQGRLLELLAEKADKLRTNCEITRALWGEKEEVDLRRIVGAVRGLRRQLELAKGANILVSNVRGCGYSLHELEETEAVEPQEFVIKFDAAKQVARVNGRPYELGERQFRLMKALYEADRPMTWRELLPLIGGTGKTRQGVYNIVESLRSMISPDIIKKVPGNRGYWL